MIKPESNNIIDQKINVIREALSQPKKLCKHIEKYDSDIYFDFSTGEAINSSQFKENDDRYGLLFNLSKIISSYTKKVNGSYMFYNNVLISNEDDVIRALNNLIKTLYEWRLFPAKDKYKKGVHITVDDLTFFSYDILIIFLKSHLNEYTYDDVYKFLLWANDRKNKIDISEVFNETFNKDDTFNNLKLSNYDDIIKIISHLYLTNKNDRTIQNINKLFSIWLESKVQLVKIKNIIGNEDVERAIVLFLQKNNLSKSHILTKQLIAIKELVDSFTTIKIKSIINIYPYIPFKNKKYFIINKQPLIYRLNHLNMLFSSNLTNLDENDQLLIFENEYQAFQYLVQFSNQMEFDDDSSNYSINHLLRLNKQLNQIKEKGHLTLIKKEDYINQPNLILI